MVVRHRQIDFASGALVFPGGRVESSDKALAGGDSHGAFRVAAIRETWEECGVLLAEVGQAPEAEGEFAAMLAEHGNSNAASDACVAALMAEAACKGAIWNVRINLAALTEEARAGAAPLAEEARHLLATTSNHARAAEAAAERLLGA